MTENSRNKTSMFLQLIQFHNVINLSQNMSHKKAQRNRIKQEKKTTETEHTILVTIENKLNND